MSGTRGIRLFAIAVLSLSSLLVAAPHRAAAQDALRTLDRIEDDHTDADLGLIILEPSPLPVSAPDSKRR